MFRGTGTALITPFRDGAVDFEALTGLLNFQIENGVNALIVLGTTGEAATMTGEERDAVITHALKVVDGRVPVIIGTGTNNTATTIALSRRAEELGYVHQVSNIDGPDFSLYICNCAWDTCMALRTSWYTSSPALSKSNYTAKVDPNHCVACGGCVEVCPQNAVKLGKSSVKKSLSP